MNKIKEYYKGYLIEERRYNGKTVNWSIMKNNKLLNILPTYADCLTRIDKLLFSHIDKKRRILEQYADDALQLNGDVLSVYIDIYENSVPVTAHLIESTFI